MKRLLAIVLAGTLLCAVGCTDGNGTPGSSETERESVTDTAERTTDSTSAGDGYTAFY